MNRSFLMTILDLLGVDTEKFPNDAEIRFSFLNAPQSWEVFVLLGIAAVIMYGAVHLYLRELNTCPRRVAIALALTRVSVFSLLLFAIYLGPAVAHSRKQVVEPYVLVVIDNSVSMGHRDYYLDEDSIGPVVAASGRSIEQIREHGLTRAELLNELFARDDGKFFKDLQDKGRVKVLMLYGSDEETLTETDTDDASDGAPSQDEELAGAETAPDKKPAYVVIDTADGKLGKRTHLARAIREAISSVAGSPIAGIILITDGQDNASNDDPVTAAEFASKRTRKTKKGGRESQSGVRIFPVAVGDSSQPRNLRIVEMDAQEYVWQGDPFEIQAVVAGEGLGEQSVQVSLHYRLMEGAGGQPGSETPIHVETQSVSLGADGGQRTVTFTHQQKTLGRYAYYVRVQKVERESNEHDNQRQTQVHVKSEKARVLLIAGGPQWDYRVVQAMLTRDKQFDLSVWLQSMDPNMNQEGNTRITKLPYLKKDLEKYDVIMMLDPDPTAEFNKQWMDTLAEHVDEGGGLLYMAGPKYSSKFLVDFRSRDIVDLLPVSFGDIAKADAQQFPQRFARAWPLRVVTENIDRPIMRFTPDAQLNKDIWQHMPGVYWSFPAVKGHQSARVLLEHSSGDPLHRHDESFRPLLATGRYGAGHVVYMGFNSTWRWRQVGSSAEFFDSFWIQTVRYLVEGRVSKSRRRGVIDTGAREFNVGDKVTVRATLRDPSREPLTKLTVMAKLKGPDPGSPVVDILLTAVDGRPGEYIGEVRATQVDQNQIWIDLEGDNAGETLRVSHEITITKSKPEMRDLRLNRALLLDIAKASAGDDEAAREKAKVFEIDELFQIHEALPRRRETFVTTSPWTDLWDNGFVLALLVGLLSIEWAVRKHYKLM